MAFRVVRYVKFYAFPLAILKAAELGRHLSHRASMEWTEFRGEHKMKSNIFIHIYNGFSRKKYSKEH